MNITITAIRKQRNQDDSKPEVARMLTAIPLWTATEILWMRWRCVMGKTQTNKCTYRHDIMTKQPWHSIFIWNDGI